MFFGDMDVAKQILASKSPTEQKIIGQWIKNISNVSLEEWEQKQDRVRSKRPFKLIFIF